MVTCPIATGDGYQPRPSRPGCPYNRCQPLGLGSSPSVPDDPGDLDSMGTTILYQQTGSQGHQIDPFSLQRFSSPIPSTHTDGQHLGEGLHQLSTRNQIQGTDEGSYSPISVDGAPSSFHQGGTSSRDSQHGSGLAKSRDDR